MYDKNKEPMRGAGTASLYRRKGAARKKNTNNQPRTRTRTSTEQEQELKIKSGRERGAFFLKAFHKAPSKVPWRPRYLGGATLSTIRPRCLKGTLCRCVVGLWRGGGLKQGPLRKAHQTSKAPTKQGPFKSTVKGGREGALDKKGRCRGLFRGPFPQGPFQGPFVVAGVGVWRNPALIRTQ
jgi:hypothetical protein